MWFHFIRHIFYIYILSTWFTGEFRDHLFRKRTKWRRVAHSKLADAEKQAHVLEPRQRARIGGQEEEMKITLELGTGAGGNWISAIFECSGLSNWTKWRSANVQGTKHIEDVYSMRTYSFSPIAFRSLTCRRPTWPILVSKPVLFSLS